MFHSSKEASAEDRHDEDVKKRSELPSCGYNIETYATRKLRLLRDLNVERSATLARKPWSDNQC